jgi:hypothetical protein
VGNALRARHSPNEHLSTPPWATYLGTHSFEVTLHIIEAKTSVGQVSYGGFHLRGPYLTDAPLLGCYPTHIIEAKISVGWVSHGGLVLKLVFTVRTQGSLE